MRRTIGMVALVQGIACFASPPSARAEGLFIPWAGPPFGDDGTEGDVMFGASAAFMGAGIAGLELDFGYSPDHFGEAVDNHLLTGMVSLILGAPIGGTEGRGVRPYFVGGVGLIRSRFDLANGDMSNNDPGLNAGAGVMGFFGDHVGLRGDVRYFRNFSDVDLSEFELEGDNFDFWRASIGIVFR